MFASASSAQHSEAVSDVKGAHGSEPLVAGEVGRHFVVSGARGWDLPVGLADSAGRAGLAPTHSDSAA